MIYNYYISASNVTLKTYLSPLESLFWNDFMGHIRELCDMLRQKHKNQINKNDYEKFTNIIFNQCNYFNKLQ